MALLGRPRLRVEAVVFLVAVACRLGVIVRSGGLHGDFGYDGPVYFAGAVALTHGRLPYRDFVFLHPPGQLLVLAPFGWLTRVVSDQTAFMVANLSVTVVGAIAAVLVVRICRHLNLGRQASLIGGLFYATWFGAVGAEYLTKLEPFGSLFILGAVLLALKAQRSGTPWLWAAAGAALAVAVCVKIWWVVPAVGVVLWQVFSARRARGGAIMAAGAVGAGLLVTVPFFAQAPHQMWASVITDQLGRHRRMDPLRRVQDLGTLSRLDISGLTLNLGTLLAGVVFLAVVAGAWRVRAARPVVVILAAQLAVLLAAPSWFPYYADYVSGAVAITVAAAACHPPHRRRVLAGTMRWLPLGFAASITLAILVTESVTVRPLPGAAALNTSVGGARCVMSDSPMGLIELNALSRGLAAGCPNWIDVTGRTYGPDNSDRPRSKNAGWQRDLTGYLRSGDAIIIVRRRSTGISRTTQEAISRDGVLARVAGQTVYRVRHP
jgi:alpha-1,2-mannosyltransferase